MPYLLLSIAVLWPRIRVSDLMREGGRGTYNLHHLVVFYVVVGKFGRNSNGIDGIMKPSMMPMDLYIGTYKKREASEGMSRWAITISR